MTTLSPNLAISLKQFPQGLPDPDTDFQCMNVGEPTSELKSNEVQIELVSLSMDPFLRGRMTQRESYIDGFKIGEPISGFGIGRIIKSNNKNFKIGSFITGMFPWQQRFNFDPTDAMFSRRIDRKNDEEVLKNETNLMPWIRTVRTMNNLPGISSFLNWINNSSPTSTPSIIANSFPLTYNTSILGMPGLTAWLGLMKLCQPKSGETLFVSAASGAVGQIVGQLGKIKGLRVVGSAGSDIKCKYLKTELNFDDAFNYKLCKNVEDIKNEIKKSCPNGIDCYYDNVGGEMLDAVLATANQKCRISICGAISQYNVKSPDQIYGVKNTTNILAKNIKIEGFVVNRLIQEYGTTEAIMDLVECLASKKLKYTEDIVTGKISEAPKCFVRMLKGDNFGKQQFKLI